MIYKIYFVNNRTYLKLIPQFILTNNFCSNMLSKKHLNRYANIIIELELLLETK